MTLMAPLWLTMPTGPSCGGSSRNMDEKLSTAPVPKFASPCVFGPIIRMPCARARLTIRAFGRFALRARFAETRGHHYGNLHAEGATFVQRADSIVTWHC